jgi:sulfur carrier protein
MASQPSATRRLVVRATLEVRNVMPILFNGEQREIASGMTIAQLLDQLDLQPRYLAVEVNRELVPRDRHADHVIHPGDQLEVVTLVGGG